MLGLRAEVDVAHGVDGGIRYLVVLVSNCGVGRGDFTFHFHKNSDFADFNIVSRDELGVDDFVAVDFGTASDKIQDLDCALIAEVDHGLEVSETVILDTQHGRRAFADRDALGADLLFEEQVFAAVDFETEC